MDRQQLVKQIKAAIHRTDETAQAILYGSQARGDWNADSDIDLLILVDGDQLSLEREELYTSPLYNLEWQWGVPISPMVMLKKEWNEKKNKTPFYLSIQREGVML